jgi:hypothetical protein
MPAESASGGGDATLDVGPNDSAADSSDESEATTRPAVDAVFPVFQFHMNPSRDGCTSIRA